jgi:hypothetical protein
MSFMAALPAIAEAAGVEEAGAATAETAGMSAGQIGRLASMGQGMTDGKNVPKKSRSSDIMADLNARVTAV